MLPFQIAAGILLAALVIFLARFGMSVFRSNDGWRGAVGAAIFACSLILGWWTVLGAFAR